MGYRYLCIPVQFPCHRSHPENIMLSQAVSTRTQFVDGLQLSIIGCNRPKMDTPDTLNALA